MSQAAVATPTVEKTSPLPIEVGKIIYPTFDPCWQDNQHAGRTAWSAIRFRYDPDKNRYFTRAAKVPPFETSSGKVDPRMNGKWHHTTVAQRGLGLIIFVDKKDLEEHIVQDTTHNVWVLSTDPKVLGLKITRANKSSAVARVIEVALP